MNHPLVMYDLAKLKIAEDLRQAEHDRMIRHAGEAQRTGIDAVPFRQRLARPFGPFAPIGRAGASTSDGARSRLLSARPGTRTTHSSGGAGPSC